MPAWRAADATCAGTYCHGGTLTGGVLTQPRWTDVGGAAMACGACHGAPPPAPHPAREDCATCHPDTVRADGSLNLEGGRHLDGRLDLALLTCDACHGAPPPAPHPASEACVLCHAGTVTAAGTIDSAGGLHMNGRVDLSIAGCDGCHGEPGQPAPPRALDGATETVDPGVGAHRAHLEAGTVRHPVACDACHVVPAELGAPDHLDGDSGAELRFSGLSSFAGATPVYDPVTLSCADTWCHGGRLTGGRQTTPIWTRVDGSQLGCDACHGAPPPAPHPAVGACETCHPETILPGGDIDLEGGRHIDGQVQTRLQGCDGCHGQAGQAAPPRDLSGDLSTDAAGVGAHRAHLEGRHLRPAIACGECHPVPAAVEAVTHLDAIPGATMRFGALATTAGLRPDYDAATLTCTNVYCHGATLSGGVRPSPVWNRVDGTARACDACHGAPPPAPHPARGDCSTCHPATVRPDGTIDVVGGHHIDGRVDVAALGCDACHGSEGDPAPPRALDGTVEPTSPGVGAHDAHLRGGAIGLPVPCDTCHLVPVSQVDPGHLDPTPGAEVEFSGLAIADGAAPAYDPAAWSCSEVYCHGATLGGRVGPGPVWIDPDAVASCDACHGAPPPAPHPAFGACSACHPATVRPDGTIDVAGGKHVDGQVDVLIPGCDGCHGVDGQAAPPRALDGREDTAALGVGAHRAHLTGSSLRGPIPCASCHAVPANVVAAGHLDETPVPEVRFNGLARADGAAPRWERATATCTGVYCHGATRPGGRDTTPVWTRVDGSQVTCGACHGTPPPAPHVASDDCSLCHPRTVLPGGAINLAGNAHINGQVEVTVPACGGCHGTPEDPAPPPALDGAMDPTDPAVGAHETHLAGGLVSGPIGCTECHVVPADVVSPGHLDAVAGAEVVFGRLATTGGLAARYTPATGRCDTVYCHGAGLTGGGLVRPVWNVVDGTQAACGTCHGAPPPPPHSASDQCFRCHPGTVLGNGEIDLVGGLHVNGVVEATAGHPDGWTNPDQHGAAFNDGGAGACGGCHGADLSGGDVGVSCDRCHPGWRSNCTFCHGGTDNQTGAPPEAIDGAVERAVFGVGAHTRHVAQTALHGAYDCTRCHTKPLDALTVGHIDGDGRAEVRMDGRNAAAVYDRGVSSCASTYCHGDGVTPSPVIRWTVGGPYGCASCHDDQTVPRASNTLRGAHEDHVLGERFTCQECHRSVVNAVNGIVAPALHVDGSVQVSFLVAGFSYVGGRCTGSCHGENHQGERW